MPPVLSKFLLALALLFPCTCAFGEVEPLTDCAAIRALAPDVAAQRLPVQVRGVVTFSYPQKNVAFVVQSGKEGTYVERGKFARDKGLIPAGWSWPELLPPGTLVELSGVTGAGDYAPVIYPKDIRIVGTEPLPEPTTLSIAELLDGKWDCQRVRVRGVVQFAEAAAQKEKGAWCELVAHSGHVRFHIDRLGPSTNLQALVDSEVEVTGVMFAYWNSRRELLGARINVADAGDVRVLEHGPEDPFAVPDLRLTKLQPFSPGGSTLHRRRCTGTVTLAWPGRGWGQVFYIQEGQRGVRVETDVPSPIAPGDRVEVSGFVEVTENFGKVHAAAVRKLGTAPLPVPVPVDRRRALGSEITGRTVTDAKDVDGTYSTFEGRLVKVDVSDHEPRLMVESEGRLVQVSFSRDTPLSVLSRFDPGSVVRINGVVRVDLTSDWPAQEHPRPVSFRFLVPTPDDVVVLSAAPWWTAERLWALLGGIAVILALTLVWNSLLRNRVEERGTQLAEEMRARREAAVEFDATLRERQRLAADLHDTMEQSLTGIAFRLETMVLQRQKAQDTSANLDHVRHLLASIREDVRRSVWNLRADALEGHTLPEALRSIAERLADRSDLIVAVETEGAPQPLPDFIAGNLLLLAQEAMTNALKHGEPRSIIVRVVFGDGTVKLSVEDDGCGFDPAQAATPREGHFGIQGMRERVKRLGGKFDLESTPGRGTCVAVTVPMRQVDSATVEP